MDKHQLTPTESSSKRKTAVLTSHLPHLSTLSYFICLMVLVCLTAYTLVAQTGSGPAASATSLSVDPNKGPSEFNHHIAGWALVGVGLLVLACRAFPALKAYRYIWPSLFVIAGVFIAVWSDGEIWPRGNLSWLWLLQHDAEARQHKIYSILLIAIGVIEYLRVCGHLSRFWKTWAFPILAVIGSGMLLIHDHTGGSGARSPEALSYLVNPNLDVDGSPFGRAGISAHATNQSIENSMEHMSADAMDHSATDLFPGSMNHSHSQSTMERAPAIFPGPSHHHTMTKSALRVEHEHFWFMIVGLGIGLFKLVSDGEFFRYRVIPYIWPACMAMLGFMLVFYRE
jgi:hypothetical protein